MVIWNYDINISGLSEHDKSTLIHKGIKKEMIEAACKVARRHVLKCRMPSAIAGTEDAELEKLLIAVDKLKQPEQAEESVKPQQGVLGPPCPHCSHEFYLRTGVCLTCCNCGESSSCG